jgi:hypothetical protein
MGRVLIRPASLTFFLALLCLSACKRHPPEIFVFDQIVTKDLIAQHCAHPVPFKWETASEPEGKLFAADFDIKKPGHRPSKHPDFYLVSIKVSPTKESYPFVENAKPSEVFFGPGGAAWSLHFLTKDRTYHIQVSFSNKGSVASVNPNIDLKALAQAISEAYDKLKS